MSNSPFKVALLGAGYISRRHAEALGKTKNAEICAICDLSAAAAEGFGREIGVDTIYTDLGQMLQESGCDAVHVLTPPNAHEAPAREILEAGKHAFVEKPLALSSAACAELDALAKAKGVKLGVNHNFLMLPSYDRLLQDRETKKLGPIDALEARWRFSFPPMRSGPYGMWPLRSPENIVFELGPHLFAFVAHLFGKLDNIRVTLGQPVEIPGGLTHFQDWRVQGEANGAIIDLQLRLTEGSEDRSVTVRGLGGAAHYDFGNDLYEFTGPQMGDIVIGPLATAMGRAGRQFGAGVENAIRQFTSLNVLNPYGLSITRAVQSFYGSLEANTEIDPRLTAGLAATGIGLIEKTVEAARPHFKPAPAPIATETPPKPTMLVIGGTGFIGRYLVDALANAGYGVRVLSRGKASGFDRADGRISVMSGSLKSEEDLARAMEGIKGVFHLARTEESSWEGYLENDVAVAKRIGEACVKAGVQRLVYTGTIDSYDAGRPDVTISEDTPFDADLEGRNLYARSKATCEQTLEDYAKESGLDLVIVRPGIVIGRGGPLQHWGIGMWRGATALKLWGAGDTIMPFVLVDDTADGLVKAMEAPAASGQSFNLIGDRMLSARDYIDAIESQCGVKLRAEPTPTWRYYLVDLAKYYAKTTLARKRGLTKPSKRDWQSRTQASPFDNAHAKDVLGWAPEADRAAFIQRGIVDANLFGVGASNAEAAQTQARSAA
ncbi:MAG: NAD-dependent epimerase/dehydratase family protein [Pseudomonadota bacterium]